MSEFENINDEEIDEFETVVLFDEETNEEIEFAILDTVDYEGSTYVLGVECELLDDDDCEAVIFKRIVEDGNSLSYALVENDDEFDKVADLFRQSAEYDVEIND